MKRFAMSLICAVSILALAASTASANERPNRLDEGVWSLAVGFPGGGNSYAPGYFGLWKMVGSSMNLGINVGFDVDSTFFGLSPALKYYFHTNTKVLPHIFGQLDFSYQDGAANDVAFGLMGGLGVDWFPVPEFSVGAYTGLALPIVSHDDSDFTIGTMTSGLTASFYFK